jgi:hypothetical protein
MPCVHRSVIVGKRPDPVIAEPTDAVVRVAPHSRFETILEDASNS